MRAEHWYILKGKCDIVTDYFDSVTKVTKYANESYVIEKDVMASRTK